MPVDLSRVASKAIEAALEDGGQQHHRRGSAVRALAAGAVLAVGARAAISKTPGPVRFGLKHLPGMSELRDMPERLRERMADAGWLHDETDIEEPEDVVDDDVVDEDAEPQGEGEEDFDEDDFDEDEPEDEGDEDFDDEDLDDAEEDLDDEEEPEAEGEEDFDDEEEFDDEEDFEDESGDEAPAPELELESEDDEDLHPEDRPPRPPRSKSASRR